MERKRSKKWLIIVAIVLIVAVLAVVFVRIFKNDSGVKFNNEEVSEQYIKLHGKEGMEKRERQEAINWFGLPVDNEGVEIEFLTNFDTNKVNEQENPMAVLLMKTDEEDFYNVLETFVMINGEGEDKLAEMCLSSILKRYGNYIYLIMGNDARELERELLILDNGQEK